MYGGSKFSAQNISILPVYNRIYTREATFVPKKYTECNWQIDEDLPIYFHNWKEHIGLTFADAFDLYSWVNLNIGGVTVSINDWMNLDMFIREAIKLASNKVFHEQKKEAEQMRQDMERKIEDSKPHRSAFEGIPKPSFFQQ